MDLERLGRADLARTLLDTYRELTDTHHPMSLVHHHVAYRAGVRAKIAYLSVEADATGEQAAALTGAGRRPPAAWPGPPDRRRWAAGHRQVDARGHAVAAPRLGAAAHRRGAQGPRRCSARPGRWRGRVPAGRHGRHVHGGAAPRGAPAGDGRVGRLDASWSAASHRADAAAVAARPSSELWQLRCDVDPAVAHARLTDRRGAPSAATRGVHDEMASRFAPWDDAIVIATEATPAAVADTVNRVIGLPPHPDE